MARKPDWNALDALFQPPSRSVERAPSAERTCVTYRGEAVPRWLARELVQERAAICEYDGGMSRADAEAMARQGLGA